MSPPRVSATVALFCLTTALGCQEAQPPPPAFTGPLPTVYSGTPEGVTPITPGSLPEDEREAFVQASFEAYQSLYSTVISAQSWKDADAALSAELDRHPLVPRYALEQNAASYILHAHLLQADGDEAAQAALRYASLLAENGSFDAVLIEDVIETHGDRWEPGQRGALARKVSASAANYVQNRSGCDGCSLDDLLQKDGVPEAAHLRPFANAAHRLEQIAEK